MNDLKNLTSCIEKEAADYREKALTEAALQVEEIRKKYNKEADAIRSEYAKKAENAKAAVDTSTKASISMQGRNMMLETKNELIKDVFERAKNKISSFDGEKRSALYAHFSEEALQNKDGGELMICRNDEASAEKILAAVNKTAFEKGMPALTLSEKRLSGDCGIVIAYGDLEYNCMLDTMIEGSYSELSQAAVRILFS